MSNSAKEGGGNVCEDHARWKLEVELCWEGRISIVVSISPNHFTRYGIPATAFQPAPKILLYTAFIFQILAGF